MVVTPDGLPLAYEVMAGNTSNKTTLRDFRKRIETQYGTVRRTWVMGIPTEEVLAEMRAAETPVHYTVGTPRGRLGQLEQNFLSKPWTEVRDTVQVKLVERESELYVLARSGARRDKEQAMRRRRLKKLVKRLHELRQQKLTRDQLLIKLGAARKEAGPAVWRIIDIQLPDRDQAVTPDTFCFKLNWQRLREARRREGSYLLRSNVTGGDPAQLWAFYLQLVEVEQAFKELKGDLAIRPIYHQTDERIEAHIFVAFLAYCLQVTLKQRLRSLATGLTPRAVLDRVAAIQMVDVQLPTDGWPHGHTVALHGTRGGRCHAAPTVVQAPAPARLIEGGIPTEAMIAHVLVARYADHLPLYRQAQILARQGVILERSNLSFWMGYAAAEVAPVVARLREMMLASTRIFANETVVPVLDPGRGRTKQGYFWAMARDDRPWGGSQPPAYSYAPGRGHTHANALLGGYRRILQCDGYAAYKKFAGSKSAKTSVTLAFCWSHVRACSRSDRRCDPLCAQPLGRIVPVPRRWSHRARQQQCRAFHAARCEARVIVHLLFKYLETLEVECWHRCDTGALYARPPPPPTARPGRWHGSGTARPEQPARREGYRP